MTRSIQCGSGSYFADSLIGNLETRPYISSSRATLQQEQSIEAIHESLCRAFILTGESTVMTTPDGTFTCVSDFESDNDAIARTALSRCRRIAIHQSTRTTMRSTLRPFNIMANFNHSEITYNEENYFSKLASKPDTH